jgi:hypothetical protein
MEDLSLSKIYLSPGDREKERERERERERDQG